MDICIAKTKKGTTCTRKSKNEKYCNQHYKLLVEDGFNPEENEEENKIITRNSVGENLLYEENITGFLFGPTEMDSHSFKSEIDKGINPQRLKRLNKEIRFLKNNLPIHFNSSIAVRIDSTRINFVKAIIFAPNDTPYDSGCFEFDIYFPPQYPHVPPKMLITTTGGGRIRFNPNLYASGKVCLSLLGTWRGRNAQENWTKSSSIWQVLISIQSAILGEKWAFLCEPGFENALGTPKGEKDKYLSRNGGVFLLREYTIKYAMIEQIKKPPKGFEELVRNHFIFKKNYIKIICSGWLDEALKYKPIQERHIKNMSNLINELHEELDCFT
jgi:ubiquitin-protein ligase